MQTRQRNLESKIHEFVDRHPLSHNTIDRGASQQEGWSHRKRSTFTLDVSDLYKRTVVLIGTTYPLFYNTGLLTKLLVLEERRFPWTSMA
jgi:hypothetical protein